MRAITFLLWALVTVGTMIVITMPISLQVHLITAVLFLGVMMVIKTLRLDGVWRLLLLALGTAIVLRYAFWRTTSTLPPFEQWGDFIPGLLLYLGEMYCIMMLALSLFVISNPIASRPSRSCPAYTRSN